MSNLRAVEECGLVHYADRRGIHGELIAWCGLAKGPLHKGARRQMVTCLMCLHERRRRGGKGSLLGDL